MAQVIQFDEFEPGSRPECQACEAMLTDALDDLLGPADKLWFDAHIAVCEHCSAMLADAQRGAAWLAMLKFQPPEPSAHLLDKIFAQTSGSGVAMPGERVPEVAVPFPAEQPARPYRAPLLPFRSRPAAWPGSLPRFTRFAFEPRLAMTAAMAFFSIALTLNLTGVRLDQLRVADLNPTSIKRSFYEAKGDAARRYDSLRVVHVLESRVDDLQAAGIGTDVQPENQGSDRSQPEPSTPAKSPAAGTGSSTENKNQESKPQGESRYGSPRNAPGLLPASRPRLNTRNLSDKWGRA